MIMENKINISVYGELVFTSPGSEAMACQRQRMCGNSGGPVFSLKEASMPY